MFNQLSVQSGELSPQTVCGAVQSGLHRHIPVREHLLFIDRGHTSVHGGQTADTRDIETSRLFNPIRRCSGNGEVGGGDDPVKRTQPRPQSLFLVWNGFQHPASSHQSFGRLRCDIQPTGRPLTQRPTSIPKWGLTSVGFPQQTDLAGSQASLDRLQLDELLL